LCEQHRELRGQATDPPPLFSRAPRGRPLRAIAGLDRFRPLIEQALQAFRSDCAYGEAIAAQACVILRKRACWRTRVLIGQLAGGCHWQPSLEIRGEWDLVGLDAWLLGQPLPPVPLTPVSAPLHRFEESTTVPSDVLEHVQVAQVPASEHVA
jgi:hypothetical protein